MTVPNYLGGKKSPYDAHWSKRATIGDVLAEEHRKANPEPTPWQETRVGLTIILCTFSLLVLGAAAWGWPEFVSWYSGLVEVGVTRD